MTKKNRLLLRGRIFGAEKPSDVVLEDGRVAGIVPAGQSPADFGSPHAIIGPTLFDMQINGAGGFDLQGGQVTVDDVYAVSEVLARYGVSRWIPTLVTGLQEEMEHGCRVIAEAARGARMRRVIPGIHLEGPHISPLDGPRGAHPKEHVRLPSLREFQRLQKASENRVICVTLAPELPGALRFIKAVSAQGVLVSLGHHAATAAQIRAAVDVGVRLSTHLGNGSSPMMHRQLNPLWPQLAEDRMHAAFIADLHHVPGDALKTFVRAKGHRRSILTSDATSLMALPPGIYTFAGAKVELRSDGKICLCGTDLLAGSGVPLLQGVVNAWRCGAMSLPEAFASATTIPARLFGVPAPPNCTRVGRPANLVLFEVDARTGRVQQPTVFLDGTLLES